MTTNYPDMILNEQELTKINIVQLLEHSIEHLLNIYLQNCFLSVLSVLVFFALKSEYIFNRFRN